jgi:mono/diheme cytochrome c family protein
MIRIKNLAAASLLALAFAAGCGNGHAASGEAPPPTTGAPDDNTPKDPTAAADAIFQMRCSQCHGPEGNGQGPAAAALQTKPRNFHDTAWQASVTDDHIEKIIREGGPSVGKSPLMPPNPDLVSKPDVVSALRAKVRAFGK